MSKATEVTFQQGMQKDVDKSLMSNKSYLDATNVRLITTEGSTTGSLENLLGMRSIIMDGGSTIRAGQQIIGSCQIRSSIILFTTSNITSNPSAEAGKRSCIYKLVVDTNPTVEQQTSLTLLYDDNLNDSGGYLDFSTYYPIKAVSRYETAEIQKIYWTDGYNNVRYANIADNLTSDGTAYDGVTIYYFSTDKFEFQPHFTLTKPTLVAMTSGSLIPGAVQYAYQLYKLNGAETTISPLSNVIHITADSDTLSTTANGYFGIENTGTSAGKGCKVQIVNSTTGFNRIRLYRVHYTVLDATPTISIVTEMSTDPAGETLSIIDTGNELSQVTVDEFNITSTELFVAQDLAAKDDMLFAANIEEHSFDITDFDTRAIRFRNWDETVPDSDTTAAVSFNESDALFTRIDDNTMQCVIADFKSLFTIVGARTVTGVTVGGTTETVGITVDGVWEDGVPDPHIFSEIGNNITITDIVFGDPDLTFNINTSGTDFFGIGFVSVVNCDLMNIWFTYDYTHIVNHQDAYLNDSIPGDAKTITVPAGDTPAQWDTAGWTSYTTSHDGQNIFNDPLNDYDAQDAYKYQRNGSTLGAEGPYIKVGFTTSNITLNTTADSKYYDSPSGSTIDSYYNMANPYLSGRRSWQRDETYRLYVVFYNEHGQASWPNWICDLKFPSLKDIGYELTSLAGDTVTGKALYPTVEFKSFPSTATSAQIYVVPREDEDKSILTQCIAIPTDLNVWYHMPILISNNLDAVNIVKLASPEIVINRNITSKNTDYLDFVGRYNTSTDNDLTNVCIGYYKLRDFDSCTKAANNETTINTSLLFTPNDTETTVGSFTFKNYEDATNYCFGGTGLVVDYVNASWTPRGLSYNVVNYRQNVYSSQYGGNTYEARTKNYCRPCSEMITTTATPYTCFNGDTFISYFQYLDNISDLSRDCSPGTHDSYASVIYVPLESSINCDLRHDQCIKDQYSIDTHYLMQEVAGVWVDNAGAGDDYSQPTDLYLYNPVFSQESILDYRYCKPADYDVVTSYDCRIKSSVQKVNGEISDNWTKFGINEYLDVDTEFGELNAIKNVNDNMFYWQDKGFGRLSINERSLITDNNASQLVLGTGGILDRYDYMSDRVGCKDKFSIIRGRGGVYWYDRVHNNIQSYTDKVDSLSRSKGIQSYLDSNYLSAVKVISAYDIENDEILYTFINSGVTNSFTLSYNELMGCFASRYTYIPTLYMPFDNKLLTTTSGIFCNNLFDLNRIFLLNSLHSTTKRCYFYGLTQGVQEMFHDSTVKVLFNPEYNSTKVFDNLYFITNLYNGLGTEVFDVTFDQIRCYDDYQNSDYVNLSMYSNLNRRERMWNMAVPRNIVALDVSLYPDIFEPTNFDINRTYKERLRDRYLITDFKFMNNGLNDKFVFNKVGCTYRASVR